MARKFPSPLGASYFQIKKNTTNKNSRRVSVPSRGILFPNAISARLASRIFLVSVPSRGILFPNNRLHCNWLRRFFRVSVPSRGILFPNAFIDDNGQMYDTVSVPSRGILFPNGGLPYIRIFSKRFRPLSGHLISKWTMNFMPLKWVRLVSVPSRGILFPNKGIMSMNSIV